MKKKNKVGVNSQLPPSLLFEAKIPDVATFDATMMFSAKLA
jgi:hypothetical protein